MADLTHAEMDRRISEAMGWTEITFYPYLDSYSGRGPDGAWRRIRSYTTDANAALEAAAKLAGAFVLERCVGDGEDDVWYEADCQGRYPKIRVATADTPTLAICKMLCAWLDEQEK